MAIIKSLAFSAAFSLVSLIVFSLGTAYIVPWMLQAYEQADFWDGWAEYTQDLKGAEYSHDIKGAEPAADAPYDAPGTTPLAETPAIIYGAADPPPWDAVRSGTVGLTIDGDTLYIDGTSIRLALVDAPERGEAGHEEAGSLLREYCPGDTAVVYDTDSLQQDPYGRTIAKVWCYGHPPSSPDRSVNELLIDAGAASLYTRFCKASEFGMQQWAQDAGC